MQISSLTSARDWQIFKWPKQGHRLAGDDRAQQECEACSLFSSLPLKRQTHHDQSWTNWCRFDYLSIPDLMPSTPDLLAGCLKPVSAASTHAFDVFSPSARDAEVQRHVEEARDRLRDCQLLAEMRASSLMFCSSPTDPEMTELGNNDCDLSFLVRPVILAESLKLSFNRSGCVC